MQGARHEITPSFPEPHKAFLAELGKYCRPHNLRSNYGRNVFFCSSLLWRHVMRWEDDAYADVMDDGEYLDPSEYTE